MSLARTLMQILLLMLILMQQNMIHHATPGFPNIQGVTNKFGATTYFEHETGVNKINLNGTEDAIQLFCSIRRL